MKKKMLEELVDISQKYLKMEHPHLKIDDTKLAAKFALLYGRLMDELEEVDAKIIRHRAGTPLEDFDLMMEIERIGLYSGFCIHIEQDDSLIASWKEKRMAID